jgi:hypothetical protein
MASEKPKRDIADFFRPFARANPPKSIPAKRPSPTPTHESSEGFPYGEKKQLKRTEPRTPVTATRGKDAVFSPYKSPFGPRSGASVTIPIRSPNPDLSQNSIDSLTPKSSASKPGGLFGSAAKKKHQEDEPLSFADISTSNQSIVKDGKVVAVRSSDDEDSDSLCSLEDLLGRSRRDVGTESSSPPDVEEDLEAQRALSLSAFTNGRSNALVGRDKLRELTSKANFLNFDISLLVGDHFDDEEIEANVAKAKQGYKASDEQERLKRQGAIDKNLLASVVGQQQGGDNLQRLFNAVERTEALTTEPTWSMFNSKSPKTDAVRMESFPDVAVNTDSWLECLKHPTLRHRAYLSGYLAEKAAEGNIPGDVITWTFNRIVAEPRDDLRRSYVRVVSAASQRWASTNLTSSLIEDTFSILGADSVVVKCATDIGPEAQVPADYSAGRRSGLLSMIEALLGISTDLTSDALFKFVKLLMRLAIDTHLMSDSRTCLAVEDAISSLLGRSEDCVSISVAKCILKDIGIRLKDPFLQTQALKHILPTSSAAASLRIRLAHIFLHGATKENTIISDLATPDISLDQLTSHLDEPRYDISRSTRQDTPFDYSTLSSVVYIFDATLANGGRPTTFPDPATERAFNHQVDILAERVKSIITSIADTGASHMRRTEAKEALNALHFRLLFGVRTKPRPKKSVFGGKDGAEYRAEERSAGNMRHFLERRKEKKGGKKGAEGKDGQEPGSLSQKSESEVLIRKQLGLES